MLEADRGEADRHDAARVQSDQYNLASAIMPRRGIQYHSSDEYPARAAPLILPAKIENAPTLLFFGGLGGNANHWQVIARQFNESPGFGAQVYSLKGQDGSRTGYRDTKHQDWEEDFLDKITAAKNLESIPPIVIAASTGAMAVANLLHKHRDSDPLLSGFALMGPPYELKNPIFQRLLPFLLSISERSKLGETFLRDRHWPPYPIHRLTSKIRELRGESPDPDALRPRPIPALIEMQRLRNTKEVGLDAIHCPTLFLVGRDDGYATEETARELYEQIPSANKRFEPFDAPHVIGATPNAAERERYWNVLKEWVVAVSEASAAR